ncbi:hypothetical protein EI94DRAFT_1754821 [Lactarius quietus]|nr:hypothetical protein EI94DRAFT_1754821 [Lactarius quietus]
MTPSTLPTWGMVGVPTRDHWVARPGDGIAGRCSDDQRNLERSQTGVSGVTSFCLLLERTKQ